MSRGYRGVIIAAVGWLTLAASPPDKGASRDNRGAPNSIERSLNESAPALEGENKQLAPDLGCERGKDNRKSDLCAQWKAADAADDSAQWAHHTFWLGVGGLAIGFLTLLAAAFAAWYARKAAEHTEAGAREAKRGADAAARQVRLMSDAQLPRVIMSQAILTRPQGEPQRVEIVERGLPPTLSFTSVYYKSTGQTPVEPAKLSYSYCVASEAPAERLYDRAADFHGAGKQMMERDWNGNMLRISLSEADIQKIEERRADLWFWCRAEFTDFLGGKIVVANLLRWDFESDPRVVGITHGLNARWVEVKEVEGYTVNMRIPAEGDEQPEN